VVNLALLNPVPLRASVNDDRWVADTPDIHRPHGGGIAGLRLR
jgi:hypothetical protein